MAVFLAYTPKIPKPAHIVQYTGQNEQTTGNYSTVTVFSTKTFQDTDVTVNVGTIRYGALLFTNRLLHAVKNVENDLRLYLATTPSGARCLLQWLTQRPWIHEFVRTEVTNPMFEWDGVLTLVDLLRAAKKYEMKDLEEEVLDILHVQVAGSIKSPYLLYLAARRIGDVGPCTSAMFKARATAMLRGEPLLPALVPTGLLDQSLNYPG